MVINKDFFKNGFWLAGGYSAKQMPGKSWIINMEFNMEIY